MADEPSKPDAEGDGAVPVPTKEVEAKQLKKAAKALKTGKQGQPKKPKRYRLIDVDRTRQMALNKGGQDLLDEFEARVRELLTQEPTVNTAWAKASLEFFQTTLAIKGETGKAVTDKAIHRQATILGMQVGTDYNADPLNFEDYLWVFNNLASPEAPDGPKRMLLEQARQDPNKFMAEYQKLNADRKKAVTEDKIRADANATIEEIDRAMQVELSLLASGAD
jgi:hypothetical protein